MGRSMKQRGYAVGALAVAGGTLLATVGAASPAAAAAVNAPAFYSGAAQGDVVNVALNLPQALPNLPNPLSIGLVSAKGTALRDRLTSHTDKSDAAAGLGSGTLVEGPNAPLSALHRFVEATLQKPSASDNLLQLPSSVSALATGGAGALAADVDRLTNGNASTANLANVDVGRIADILPQQVLDGLDQAFTQIQPQASSAIDQVVQNLQPVLQPVVQNDPTGTAAQLESALKQLSDETLPNLLKNLENSALVKLDLLDASQANKAVNGGMRSNAKVTLAGLDLLGGLVDVKAFTSEATAFANGIAGGASASYYPTIAKATIGKSILGVSLDANGLGLTVGGLPSSVVQQVNAALQQVSQQLNNVLNQLGVVVTPAAGSKSVSPDGKSAKATGGSLLVALQPPSTSKPVVAVTLGGTTAEAAAAQAPKQAAQAPALPYTGSNYPLTAGIGAALFAVALVLRRRFAG